MISTLRPPASLAKSSAASSAPISDPLPTWSANGPEKSLNTPILTVSPGICADASMAQPASPTKAAKSGGVNLAAMGAPPILPTRKYPIAPDQRLYCDGPADRTSRQLG